MNKYEINKIITERLFKYKKTPAPYSGCEYLDETGGWQPIRNFFDFENLSLLLSIIEEKGWTISYSTMKNGKRGHFIVLGVLKKSFDSFFTSFEAEGQDIQEALCSAIMKAVHE